MSDHFQRLVRTSDDPQIRSVLDAGLYDGPSPEQIRRAASVLGLSAVTGAAAVAHASAGAGAATASKSAFLVGLFKWFGIGMIAGGITVTAAVPIQSSRPTPNQRAAGSASLERVVRSPPAPTRAAQAPSVEPSASPEPVQTALAAAAPAASSVAGPSESVASFDLPSASATLRAETAMLDRARRALQSHDVAGALAALDDHQRIPSKKGLGAEALLLRVRALQQAGRGTEARRLGQSYIAEHPADGYAVRLRRELGIPTPPAAAPSAPASVKVPTASF